jgi:O-6-methylguanine DNA methyltransferase
MGLCYHFAMIYKSLSGPQIKADFYIEKGLVAKIVLSHSLTRELVWEVFSDRKAEKLENDICEWMDSYAKGIDPATELSFDLAKVAPFTKSVLERLLSLPFGSSMSYSELASSLNRPRAARAVGTACGRNPLPLLIPCHRILAASMQLGGFSGGVSIKEKLLQHEGISFRPSR